MAHIELRGQTLVHARPSMDGHPAANQAPALKVDLKPIGRVFASTILGAPVETGDNHTGICPVPVMHRRAPILPIPLLSGPASQCLV